MGVGVSNERVEHDPGEQAGFRKYLAAAQIGGIRQRLQNLHLLFIELQGGADLFASAHADGAESGIMAHH